MKIGAIVAEYNPFHNGHKYQIEKYRKEKEITHLVVAMSGNFVQRGGPALFDKFSRAEMAIRGGADLVIEIPSFFATQTAELYARGAVMSLDAMGCLDSMCFGTESEDMEKIYEAAEILSGKKGNYEENLKEYLKNKETFPKARQRALMDNMECSEDFLSGSNNILAIEYVKELIRLNSSIKPCTIKRLAAGHNSMESEGNISSATYIRENISKALADLDKLAYVADRYKCFLEVGSQLKLLMENELKQNKGVISPVVPSTTMEIIEQNIENFFFPISEKNFYGELCIEILREEGYLDEYFEVGEGIENLIRKEITKSSNFHELISSLTSKRYTKAKIRRVLFNILLGIKKNDIEEIKKIVKIPYIRVLAFNKRGTEILKEIKNNSDAIIIKSPAKIKKTEEYTNDNIMKKMFDLDIRSSNIYYQKYYRYNRVDLKKGEPDFITLKYMV